MFLAYCLSSQLSLPVVVRIYKIPLFDEAFSLLATVAMLTVAMQLLLGKQSFSSQSCSLSVKTTASRKTWVKQTKTTQKKKKKKKNIATA